MRLRERKLSSPGEEEIPRTSESGAPLRDLVVPKECILFVWTAND